MKETEESEGIQVLIPFKEFEELTALVQKLGYADLIEFQRKEGPVSTTEETHGDDGSLTFKVQFKPGIREKLIQRVEKKVGKSIYDVGVV